MRVYLAGPWKRRQTTVRDAREQLRAAGFTVDCRWIDFNGEDENDHEVMRQEALADLEDIDKSDALVVFNPEGILSEGKAFEQGYAYGTMAIPVVVVGPYTCVFQRLDAIARVDTIQEAISYLRGYQCATKCS